MRHPPLSTWAGPLRALIPTVVLVALGVSTAAAGGVSQRPADFRADVELVRLNVAVVNPSGGEVPPLSRQDFSVYDDGMRQQVELFLRPSTAPLEVALVLDSSTSMRPVSGSSRRAAMTFLSELDPDDCVLVLPFSGRVGPGRRGAAGDPGLRLFIDRVVAGGGTALHDALLRGLAALDRRPATGGETKEGGVGSDGLPQPHRGPGSGAVGGGSLGPDLGRVADDVVAAETSIAGDCPAAPDAGGDSPERRKAIVVLSDGADEDSDATFDEVLLAARRASVPVFPVAFGYAYQDRRLEARLTELARATGGRRLQSATPARLREAYAEALDYLKSSYVLGYQPGPDADPESAEEQPGAGGLVWHDVWVEIRRPLLEAVVRPGYYR